MDSLKVIIIFKLVHQSKLWFYTVIAPPCLFVPWTAVVAVLISGLLSPRQLFSERGEDELFMYKKVLHYHLLYCVWPLLVSIYSLSLVWTSCYWGVMFVSERTWENSELIWYSSIKRSWLYLRSKLWFSRHVF